MRRLLSIESSCGRCEVPPRLRGGWPSEARPGGAHMRGRAAWEPRPALLEDGREKRNQLTSPPSERHKARLDAIHLSPK